MSKNGNYLIDIGPTANGTIVGPSRTSLLQVGEWLKFSGEAIYGTQYWWVAAEDGDLRFVSFCILSLLDAALLIDAFLKTTKPDGFYIISLSLPPDGRIQSALPLPVRSGDVVTFLGKEGESEQLDWSWTGDNIFELNGPLNQMKMVENAWAFKVEYR